MKKLLLLMVLTFVLCTTNATALPIIFFGKGGLQITGEGTQICPDNAWRKCAVVHMSLSEIWDYVFAAGPKPPAQIVYFSEERGETVTLDCHLKSISSEVPLDENNFEMPEEIQGSKIVFE